MTARGAVRLLPQAALLAVAAAMAAMAWRFPRDTGEYAGAGAFPLALCAALAVLAAVRAAQKAAGRAVGTPAAAGAEPGPRGAVDRMDPAPGAWRLPVLCVLYMAALPWLGFMSSTALFTAAMLGAMGYRRAGRALAFGLALAIVLHWVFAVWMQVPLPEGWLG